MPDVGTAERMRADWNRRAAEDAHYYVAFGRRGQDEAEFQSTAADVVRALTRELRRLPPARPGEPRRALEIGCGPGRLMRPMSVHFAEIHGVDVSDEMVRLGCERLRDLPHAHLHFGDGSSLGMFPDAHFDFVYSYAVFQHIPSRDVVFSYLTEARRVLKKGGLLRCQINGLPKTDKKYDTWEGVRISAQEVIEFARANGMQLLALDGELTQYMWTTMRKRPAGLRSSPGAGAKVVRVTNTETAEAVAPARGRFAFVSLWMENFPDDCALDELHVTIGGLPAKPTFIGPPEVDGLQQVNVAMPPDVGTGLQPAEVSWLGEPLADRIVLRVIPPPLTVPRLTSVTDGTNLMSASRIETRSVRLLLEEVPQGAAILAYVDGAAATEIASCCVDPRSRMVEVNFALPQEVGAGRHDLVIEVGRRRFAPVPIEVVNDQ